MKSDFGGHDNHHYRNIYAYTAGCFGAPMPWRYFRGYNNEFANNTCITMGPGYGVGASEPPATELCSVVMPAVRYLWPVAISQHR